MLYAAATIHDYDTPSDTVTVDLAGLGELQTWHPGIKVDVSITRAYLVAGALCTLAIPDTHRLDEACVVSVQPPTRLVSAAGSTAQKTESGRAAVALDASGLGSATMTYPAAFSAIPTVQLAGDYLTSWSLSSVTATGFTATITVPSSPNTTVYVTWTATGNA